MKKGSQEGRSEGKEKGKGGGMMREKGTKNSEKGVEGGSGTGNTLRYAQKQQNMKKQKYRNTKI